MFNNHCKRELGQFLFLHISNHAKVFSIKHFLSESEQENNIQLIGNLKLSF